MTNGAKLFPTKRQCPFSQYDDYSRRDLVNPIERITLQSGQEVWGVFSAELVRHVLKSSSFSSEHSHPSYPQLFPVVRHRDKSGNPPKLTYSGMDGEEHSFHRRLANKEFGPRAIASFKPVISELADRQIKLIASLGEVDLVKGFAEPFVTTVLGQFLGLTEGQCSSLHASSSMLLNYKVAAKLRAHSSVLFREELSSIIAEKSRSGGEGVIDRLLRRYQKLGPPDVKQLIELFGALFIAGIETTVNTFTLSILILLQNVDQIVRDQHVSSESVEELLRFLSVADLVTARIAIEDTTVGDHLIRRGEGIIASTASANRDSRYFENPDKIQFDRAANVHLAFGYGRHKCLGQYLAREMLQVALSSVLRGLAGLHLDPAFTPVPNEAIIYGLESLPVKWEAAKRRN